MQQIPTQQGEADGRERRAVLPGRILWTGGDVTGSENLLAAGDDVCTLVSGAKGGEAGLLLDWGRELHGGVRIEVPGGVHRPVRVRVRFGESASEAMQTPDSDHAIHDHDVLLAWMGRTEVGITGFRFVRIDLLDPDTTLTLRRVEAITLMHPRKWLGSFVCSDDRLNQIWQTGAYTVHLCMQELVWDGIKRDRLAWVGDLHPEALVISALFGADPLVPLTLDYERDHSPLPRWMNGISSYSLWWVIIQRDWYRYHADRDYLLAQRDYLHQLLPHLLAHLDGTGGETLDGFRFLEWPTSGDKTAIDAGLQALMVIALQAGADLLETLGDTALAQTVRAGAGRAAAHPRPATASKQANALRVLAGMADAGAVNREILSDDPHRGLSTFYGYYLLEARARAGDYTGCLDLLRTYWGGMLDKGATTFWEGFETDWLEDSTNLDDLPPAPESGLRDIHADFGDWCYKGLRHSLCHGWAAGPTVWLMNHVLGITPAAPGFARVHVAPHLGDLQWARGTFPTPHGVIEVAHERGRGDKIHTTLTLPPGVNQA